MGTSIDMQYHIKAFAAQQPIHSSMQMVLESHAHKPIGLRSWSETLMYLVPAGQQDLSIALLSGLSAVR